MPDLVKPELYVGCGLTLAPEPFKDEVERTKRVLSADWHVMEFLGLVDGTPADVYDRDIIDNVGGCDAFLAVLDEPALGLGWEMSEAVRLGKPTLGVLHVNSRVSRLVFGAAARFPNLEVLTYEDMVVDVPHLARQVFADVLGVQTVPQG